jgi:deoxyribonuclease V
MIEHRWDLTIPEVTVLQKQLREEVRLTPLTKPIRTIAGADISFSRYSDIFHGGIVVF